MKILDVDVLVACEIENAPVVTLLDNRNTVAICAAASAVTGIQLTIELGPQLILLTDSNVAPVEESVNVPLLLVCPWASWTTLRMTFLIIWIDVYLFVIFLGGIVLIVDAGRRFLRGERK